MSQTPVSVVGEKLKAANVTLDWPKARLDYTVLAPDPRGALNGDPADLLVSCVMVTRGETDLIRHALICYGAQTWAKRELVIITQADRAQPVGELARQLQIPNVRVFAVPPGLTLGDQRNIALARVQGEVIMNWDDDDLSDPMRIAVSVSVLAQSGAAAAYLSRLMLWWPRRRVAAISYMRAWEGSIAVWRDQVRVFPALALGEDSPPSQALRDNHPIALIDEPTLYVYAITGRNTFGEAHFNRFVAEADCVFDGEEFQAVTDLLAARLPIRDYQDFLLKD